MSYRATRRFACAGTVGVAAMSMTVAIAACGSDGGSSSAAAGSGDAGPLLVAAAADLRPAFTDLAKRYEEQTGTKVTLTFGASGQLAQQLENGAPYALFASASVDYVDDVLASGRGDRTSRAVYAYGRLAVWSPDRTVTLDDLTSDDIKNVAIADPTHAPYGKAAEETLKAAKLYDAIKPKLVYGNNVGATQQLAASGNADAAIIARSLALASGGHLSPVPDDLHAPLAQGLVVTGTGKPGEQAREFVALLRSREGQDLLRKDGFILPADSPDQGSSAAATDEAAVTATPTPTATATPVS